MLSDQWNTHWTFVRREIKIWWVYLSYCEIWARFNALLRKYSWIKMFPGLYTLSALFCPYCSAHDYEQWPFYYTSYAKTIHSHYFYTINCLSDPCDKNNVCYILSLKYFKTPTQCIANEFKVEYWNKCKIWCMLQ